MGIISKIREGLQKRQIAKEQKREKYTYSQEKQKQLDIVREAERRQRKYEEGRKRFEAEQKQIAYERSIRAKIARLKKDTARLIKNRRGKVKQRKNEKLKEYKKIKSLIRKYQRQQTYRRPTTYVYQRQQMIPSQNKFNKELETQQRIIEENEQKRRNGDFPKDYNKRLIALKNFENQQKRDFLQRNSLMDAKFSDDPELSGWNLFKAQFPAINNRIPLVGNFNLLKVNFQDNQGRSHNF